MSNLHPLNGPESLKDGRALCLAGWMRTFLWCTRCSQREQLEENKHQYVSRCSEAKKRRHISCLLRGIIYDTATLEHRIFYWHVETFAFLVAIYLCRRHMAARRTHVESHASLCAVHDTFKAASPSEQTTRGTVKNLI